MVKYCSLFLIILILFSCDEEKPKPVIHPSKSKAEVIVEAPKIYFEKITDKNVVERLTAYGKENPESVVDIYTSKGKIRVRLFKDTPLHRANFILLVKSGYLNRALFSRVAPEFMAQFGGSYDDLQKRHSRHARKIYDPC